jgi:nucleoside-diphosphate-sugar epimerase
MNIVLEKDLNFILDNTTGSLTQLKQCAIFITGATGFFGKWLLSALQWANYQGGYGIKIVALSRDPHAFIRNYPHLAKDVTFIQGDVTDFLFPNQHYDYIIHAATEASAKLNSEQPSIMLNTIIEGTKRILEFAQHCGAKRILHTSSGAVYGIQPTNIDYITEDYLGALDISKAKSAYGEGKRIAELLGVIHSQETGIEFINARCFAFVGLYLPLTAHFAIGNFINNALNNQSIVIKGDGTAMRSYLYAADLVIWLFTILTKGKNNHAYNVGSDISYSISEIACQIQRYFPQLAIEILEPPSVNQLPERYIPAIEKAKNELGLKVETDLDAAIKKTIAQIQNARCNSG